jgi:putative pre-16S rRNA nuclease
MSRILGIDLGTRRIGLAIADEGVGIAGPLATINRGATLDADISAIARICAANDVRQLVVGLPIDASGDEGPMATGARAWATQVAEAVGLPVSLRDERLSSYEAEQRLGRMPRGRSGGPPSRTRRNAFRARVDREAASVILQDELDARSDAGAVSASVSAPDGVSAGTPVPMPAVPTAPAPSAAPVERPR